MQASLTNSGLFLFILIISAQIGCNRCYECTTQTEFGPTTQPVCGRKKNVQPLIKHLETDTADPWTCEKQ